MADDIFVNFGGAVKSLTDGHIGGYLIKFTDAEHYDLEGEYFDAATDYDIEDGRKTAVYFNHRMPLKTRDGKRVVVREKIGEGTLKLVDDGVLIDAVLYNAERYARVLEVMGWSSGTAVHLIDKDEPAKNGTVHIARWPLGLDASITPIPATPWGSQVVSLKSLMLEEPEAQLPEGVRTSAGVGMQEEATGTISENSKTMEVNKMPDEITQETEVKKVPFELDYDKLAAAVAAKMAPQPKDPGVSQGMPGRVTEDPADRGFKSLADFCLAVKNFGVTSGQVFDPRLKRIKKQEKTAQEAVKAVLGASEGVPADAGFLLPPDLTGGILTPLHEDGPFFPAARHLPTTGSYGWINGLDETSRATGSRWGGIRGYRLAEGDTKTGSKPKFRRINWELKKYAVLVYATDELLQDVSQFSAIVQMGASEELRFMANDDILNGAGIGGPHGILQSGALISETRTTANRVKFEDIVAMWARLDARSRGNAAWFINSEVEPDLDKMYLAGASSDLEPRYITYAADGVMRIKGRPVIVSEFNPALGTTGDILLADMSQYLVWEKAGIQEARSIHVEFVTDQTVLRFVYRIDGQTAMSAPVTPYKGTKTHSAFVALS